jgi:hypothetical protein
MVNAGVARNWWAEWAKSTRKKNRKRPGVDPIFQRSCMLIPLAFFASSGVRKTPVRETTFIR